MKKKLAEAKRAKNIAEWAKDEALRAKEEAVFARTEAECSKEKAEEEAYDLGMAETQAPLKAQVPRVCSIAPRFGMRLLSRVGLMPRPTYGRQSVCSIPLPSGKMPPSAPRSRMLQKRLRLPAPTLLWQ